MNLVFLCAIFFLAILCSLEAKEDRGPCQRPDRWCQSEEIARKCGVEEFCKTKNIRHDALHVAVYIEALCSDTRHFIVTQLYPTFKKLYSSGIFKLKLVPYGKAKEHKSGNKWVFSCQHGPKECYGNLIETCAIHHVKHTAKIVPFINCLMTSYPDKTNAQKCADEGGIDYQPIDECVSSSIGNQLEHQMAVETNNLVPPLTFVPWITINGAHTDQMEKSALEDLTTYLCTVYKGVKPVACHQP